MLLALSAVMIAAATAQEVPTRAPTFGPTATWSPTGTAFPTATASPTHGQCDVCGRPGTVMTALDDVLALPVANISCREALEAGAAGEIPAATCDFLRLYIADRGRCGCELPPGATLSPTAAPSDAFPPCNICGGGRRRRNDDDDARVVNNRAGELRLGNSTLQCGFVAEAGNEGLWSPEVCSFWQNVSATVCDCGPAPPSPVSPVDGGAPPPAIANAAAEDDGDDELDACFICGGPNYEFTSPKAQVPVPFEFTALFLEVLGDDVQDPFACGNLEQVQDVELWSPLVCAFLQQSAANVCGCQEVTAAPPPAPTTTTTMFTERPVNSERGGTTPASPSPPPATPTSAVAVSAASPFWLLSCRWMLISSVVQLLLL